MKVEIGHGENPAVQINHVTLNKLNDDVWFIIIDTSEKYPGFNFWCSFGGDELPTLSVRFSSHEDVFSEETPSQDILWKINIPAYESLRALHLLDKMNINAFSLFGSEESLMETVAMREFHLRKSFP